MLTKELSGELNENGTPRVAWTYSADHPGHVEDDGCGVVVTGPVKGTVVTADGTRYDVTPEVIEHLPGHGPEIVAEIEKLLESSGQLTAIRGVTGTPEA